MPGTGLSRVERRTLMGRLAGVALALTVFMVLPADSFAVAGEANVTVAENFVQQLSADGIAVLADRGLSHDQQIARFRQLLQTGVDIPRVARFALGQYWRVASPAERQDFQSLFQDWLLSNYVARFADYSGQTVTVTGGQPESTTLIVVHSKVNQTDGGPPIDVDWRVWVAEGRGRVVDVVVEGVSMAITLRSQFASVIQNNGGEISALLARMRAAVGGTASTSANTAKGA